MIIICLQIEIKKGKKKTQKTKKNPDNFKNKPLKILPQLSNNTMTCIRRYFLHAGSVLDMHVKC